MGTSPRNENLTREEQLALWLEQKGKKKQAKKGTPGSDLRARGGGLRKQGGTSSKKTPDIHGRGFTPNTGVSRASTQHRPPTSSRRSETSQAVEPTPRHSAARSYASRTTPVGPSCNGGFLRATDSSKQKRRSANDTLTPHIPKRLSIYPSPMERTPKVPHGSQLNTHAQKVKSSTVLRLPTVGHGSSVNASSDTHQTPNQTLAASHMETPNVEKEFKEAHEFLLSFVADQQELVSPMTCSVSTWPASPGVASPCNGQQTSSDRKRQHRKSSRSPIGLNVKPKRPPSTNPLYAMKQSSQEATKPRSTQSPKNAVHQTPTSSSISNASSKSPRTSSSKRLLTMGQSSTTGSQDIVRKYTPTEREKHSFCVAATSSTPAEGSDFDWRTDITPERSSEARSYEVTHEGNEKALPADSSTCPDGPRDFQSYRDMHGHDAAIIANEPEVSMQPGDSELEAESMKDDKQLTGEDIENPVSDGVDHVVDHSSSTQNLISEPPILLLPSDTNQQLSSDDESDSFDWRAELSPQIDRRHSRRTRLSMALLRHDNSQFNTEEDPTQEESEEEKNENLLDPLHDCDDSTSDNNASIIAEAKSALAKNKESGSESDSTMNSSDESASRTAEDTVEPSNVLTIEKGPVIVLQQSDESQAATKEVIDPVPTESISCNDQFEKNEAEEKTILANIFVRDERNKSILHSIPENDIKAIDQLKNLMVKNRLLENQVYALRKAYEQRVTPFRDIFDEVSSSSLNDWCWFIRDLHSNG